MITPLPHTSRPIRGIITRLSHSSSGRRDRVIDDEVGNGAGDGRPKGTGMGDDEPDRIDGAAGARDLAMQEALGAVPILIQG